MAPLIQDDEYKVRLEVFEGPLDLLLYLIKKDELDIYDIPMESVTRQYVEYLELMKMLDLNIAGEFLVMAATLMLIKSRMLLPVEVRPDDAEEEEDPRWDLVRQLVEYKKFKDTALLLEDIEEQREDIFGREPGDAVLGKDTDVALQDVGLFDLIRAFQEALKKAPADELREILAEKWTVGEKIRSLGERLRREGRFSLTKVMDAMHSRQEIVCAFLALLELVRLRQARAVQQQTYGEIWLEAGKGLSEEEEAAANAEAEAELDAEGAAQATEENGADKRAPSEKKSRGRRRKGNQS